MKKLFIAFVLLLCSNILYSQSETAKPIHGVKIEREIDYARIEKKFYQDVTVELKAADIYDIVDGVKVTVWERSTGKKIYQKRFSAAYLYGFSDKSIEVGKGNILTQIIIQQSRSGDWEMTLKEKGIY